MVNTIAVRLGLGGGAFRASVTGTCGWPCLALLNGRPAPVVPSPWFVVCLALMTSSSYRHSHVVRRTQREVPFPERRNT